MSPGAVTIVVPMFNERPGIPGLETRLLPFVSRWRATREVDLVLVDDGSTDDTGAALAPLAAAPFVQVATHPTNRGLTAALWTGLAAARGDVVCWLDSDLTYEPSLLQDLVSAVDAGADVAVASPYHPSGGVEGVSGLRLLLSRGTSTLYRLFVCRGVFTFTSMVRAWRRPMLDRCRPQRGGFLGVTEALLRALAYGAVVIDVPAVLRARAQGTSKLRALPMIGAHLALLARATLGLLR